MAATGMHSRGARSKAGIDPAHLRTLNAGTTQARTLTEALAIDHRALLSAAVPDVSPELASAVEDTEGLGILKRMAAIGTALGEHVSRQELGRLAVHRSDTVRGWACFAVAADTAIDQAEVLARLKPAATDACFTVREWVWMAARPRLVTDLTASIALLTAWTDEESANLRRFASEVLRPRGVWATHIPALKIDPSPGEPLLEPLRADPSRYVQDSVANWINDAAKTCPEWARDLCNRWQMESPTRATLRITTRALRSLKS